MKRLNTIGLALAALAAAAPASAKVTVCNKYTETIYAAIGYVINGNTETQGWWTVGEGQCATVDQGPLSSPFYLMARTNPDKNGDLHEWGSDAHLVISLDPFHFYDATKIGKNDIAMDFDELTKADDKDEPNVTWTVEDENSVGFRYDDDP